MSGAPVLDPLDDIIGAQKTVPMSQPDAGYLRMLLPARGRPGPTSLRSAQRVNNILIINKAVTAGRFTAIIVNERPGF
jgi:hypothetical protein